MLFIQLLHKHIKVGRWVYWKNFLLGNYSVQSWLAALQNHHSISFRQLTIIAFMTPFKTNPFLKVNLTTSLSLLKQFCSFCQFKILKTYSFLIYQSLDHRDCKHIWFSLIYFKFRLDRIIHERTKNTENSNW